MESYTDQAGIRHLLADCPAARHPVPAPGGVCVCTMLPGSGDNGAFERTLDRLAALEPSWERRGWLMTIWDALAEQNHVLTGRAQELLDVWGRALRDGDGLVELNWNLITSIYMTKGRLPSPLWFLSEAALRTCQEALFEAGISSRLLTTSGTADELIRRLVETGARTGAAVRAADTIINVRDHLLATAAEVANSDQPPPDVILFMERLAPVREAMFEALGSTEAVRVRSGVVLRASWLAAEWLRGLELKELGTFDQVPEHVDWAEAGELTMMLDSNVGTLPERFEVACAALTEGPVRGA